MSSRPEPTRAGRLGRVLHPTDSDGGFTLVEALVALTIFVMVAAAGTMAVVTGIRSENDTGDRVAATQIARQEVERAGAMPRTALSGLPSSTSVTRGSKTYAVTRSVSPAPGGSPCPAPSAAPSGTAVQKVLVTVRVAVPGSGRSVRLDSVLAC
ncbi:type IV pilus modification PilV family protein [Jatrophihabitans fulvus]